MSVWGHHKINDLAVFYWVFVFFSETLSETKCRRITLFSGMVDLFFTLNLCHARLHTRGRVSLA